MKKLFTLAAIATALPLIAVESANIVGYSTLSVTKSYSILAINFQNVNGTDSMAINDVFPFTTGMTKGAATTAADNIQIMNDDGGYSIYYLSNGYAGKAAISGGDGKWVKSGAYTITTDSIKNGTAFWYVSKAFIDNASSTPYNINVAGQVLMASESSREIAQQYMLIANPYPCDVPLNDGVLVTKGATKGAASTAADNIQIMKEDGGYTIYYLCNGYAGKATVAGGDGKWVKSGEFAVTTDSFPAGRGGWFVSKSGDTAVKFVSPIKE